MNKGLLLAAFFLVVLTAAVAVNGEWLIDKKKATSCFDTDGGLDYLTTGTITFTTANNNTYNFTDYCINTTIVGEYACSGDVPGQPPGWAIEVGENCINVTGNGTCSIGRCI